jgi:hypothetical protein
MNIGEATYEAFPSVGTAPLELAGIATVVVQRCNWWRANAKCILAQTIRCQ